MKITGFDDTYTQKLGQGGTTLVSGTSGGSNSGLGGDVSGSLGDASVDGLRRAVSLGSNLGTGVAVGDTLTIISTTGTPVARFATPSNTGGSALTIEEVDGSPSVSATKLVLPNGTVGVVGTVATYTPTAGSAGSLVLIEQHTAAASATLDFTAFISATYDEYLFEMLNLIPATNAARLGCRVSVAAAFVTGSNYAVATLRFAHDGSATAGQAPGAPVTSIIIDGGTGVSNNANYGVTGWLRLYSPQSAIYKRTLSETTFLDTQATPHLIAATTHGVYISSSVVDGFRFFYDTGNITSGTIRVYGIAK